MGQKLWSQAIYSHFTEMVAHLALDIYQGCSRKRRDLASYRLKNRLYSPPVLLMNFSTLPSSLLKTAISSTSKDNHKFSIPLAL